MPPAAVEYARGVLTSPFGEERHDPRLASLTLLAGQPGMIADADFLGRYLGLTDAGGTLIASNSTLTGAAPHVVGRYFLVEPEHFGSAVASLLRSGDVGALANLLPFVQQAGVRNPTEVVGALMDQLRKADSGRVAEPALLHTLAAVAPQRLIAEGCSNVAAWLPQARGDLADTLAVSGSSPSTWRRRALSS